MSGAGVETSSQKQGSPPLRSSLPEEHPLIARGPPSIPLEGRLVPQEVMVMLGEAMGFVTHVLQQPQGV